MDPQHLRNCCICGFKTDHTLIKHLRHEQDRYVVELLPHPHMEGYPGVVHGGFSSLLLDEVVAVAVGLERQREAVTHRLSVEFVKPVLMGQRLRVEGWLVEVIKAHFVRGAGQLLDEHGHCLVRAEGEFAVMSPRVRERLFRNHLPS